MIRTLIVDDQNIIRQGIKVLLENSTEIELVGFAENGKSALEQVEATAPNVVLLDINLPDIDGLTIAEKIGAKFPQVKIIMLSSCEDESYVRRAVASRAKGYLLKSVSAEELQWAIKLVHQGYSAFKSELLSSNSLSSSDRPLAVETHTDIKPKIEVPEPVTSSSTGNSKINPKNRNGSRDAAPVPRQKPNPDELELMIARSQLRQKYYSTIKNQRRNFSFHRVNISRAKKTMMSFEVKLLILIILFSLGFLVFYALS